jgi:hypothetical protein
LRVRDCRAARRVQFDTNVLLLAGDPFAPCWPAEPRRPQGGTERDLNGSMSNYIEDNSTEGPEGYFVQAVSEPTAQPRGRRPDRRARGAGRRMEDAEVRQAQRRLLWVNATLGAVLTAALVMAIAERVE